MFSSEDLRLCLNKCILRYEFDYFRVGSESMNTEKYGKFICTFFKEKNEFLPEERGCGKSPKNAPKISG